MIKTNRCCLVFSKSGPLRFISHLDLLRAFQRIIRRAELPTAYSQGFNPHMLMSFALPLPLGMESAKDYAEIVLSEEMDVREILERLNQSTPEGLNFLTVRVMAPEEPRFSLVETVADSLQAIRDNGMRGAIAALIQ